MAALTLLSTQGLSRSFGGIHAVSNVDFEISQGEIRALIGPNGAGKTTFVGLLCGRIAADSGRVIFCDRDISNLPVHKRITLGIGYTFQITSIFSRLSLFENVSLALSPGDRKKSDKVENQVSHALTTVGLHDRMKHIAGDMSYGHQRLLEIAMGIARKPRLLILDEPTQGLAQGEISRFIAILNTIRSHTTILLIEHNMDVVMEIADTISVLNFGAILAEGTPEEIRANEHVQQAYLGNSDV